MNVTCKSVGGGEDRPAVRGFTMTIDRAVLVFAGCVVIVSVLLAHFLSPWWLLLTAFVGLNLIQSAFTGFCPAAIAFRWAGLKPGCSFR